MFRRLRNERGQAMVEFVIVLPLLLFIVFLLVYAGVGFTHSLNLTDAAHDAARAAAVSRFDNQAPCPAATDAAQNVMGTATIVVQCNPVDPQPGEMMTVTVSYDYGVDLPFLPQTIKHMERTATERIQ
jgi:Flp pilus assembly protein TadG